MAPYKTRGNVHSCIFNSSASVRSCIPESVGDSSSVWHGNGLSRSSSTLLHSRKKRLGAVLSSSEHFGLARKLT